MSIPPDVLIPIQIGLTLLFEIVCQYSIRAVALLNPGGAIAQFKRNDCSIPPVEVIPGGGVRKFITWQQPSTQRSSPASVNHLSGLSIFSSAPHSSGFSRFCYSTRTKSCRLSATENFREHYPLFIMCATRRRLRSIRMFLASRSPCWASAR